MKYLLLVYGDEEGERALGREALRGIMAEHMALAARLRERGALVLGEPLTPSAEAKTLRRSLVSDGPFVETKEQLGGIYVIECDSEEEALDWARQVPDSPGLVVEVRRVADS